MAAEPPQDGTSSLNSQDAADLEKELNGAAISNTSSLSPQAHLRLQQEIMAKADASIAGALSRQARVGHYKLTLELFFAHCTSGANPLAVESPTIDQATENRIRGTGAARPYNAYQPVVVIPFETSDLPRNRNLTKRALRRFFFGQDAMSVRTYFVHNSYFNYGLREGSISDWVQLPKSISEYNKTAPEADWTRDPAPLRAACERATVNWSVLDTDGDGRINPDDAVIVLIGAWGEAAGSARHHEDVEFRAQDRAYRLVDPFVVYGDCAKPSHIEHGDAVMSFSRAGSNLSVMCHEFGHALFDLPDRYPAPDRVAHYDLMSDSNDLKFLNPFDRMRIGWLQPGLLHVGQRPPSCHAFAANEAQESALIIYHTDSPNEFWIVENRHRSSAPAPHFDSGFPEDGLAVWWVDAKTNAVALIRRSAPGMRPLDQPAYPMAGELFQANDPFTRTDALLLPQVRSRLRSRTQDLARRTHYVRRSIGRRSPLASLRDAGQATVEVPG